MIEDLFETKEKTLNIDGKRVKVLTMKALDKPEAGFEKPKYKEDDVF